MYVGICVHLMKALITVLSERCANCCPLCVHTCHCGWEGAQPGCGLSYNPTSQSRPSHTASGPFQGPDAGKAALSPGDKVVHKKGQMADPLFPASVTYSGAASCLPVIRGSPRRPVLPGEERLMFSQEPIPAEPFSCTDLCRGGYC